MYPNIFVSESFFDYFDLEYDKLPQEDRYNNSLELKNKRISSIIMDRGMLSEENIKDALGLNFKRLTVSLKTGYEKNPFTIKNYLPGYIVMGIGFKFGTKPFEKEFKNKTKKEDNMPPN